MALADTLYTTIQTIFHQSAHIKPQSRKLNNSDEPSCFVMPTSLLAERERVRAGTLIEVNPSCTIGYEWNGEGGSHQ